MFLLGHPFEKTIGGEYCEGILLRQPVRELQQRHAGKVYAIDLKLPGMLHAAIKACPVFGGKLASFDESKISSRPGNRCAVCR